MASPPAAARLCRRTVTPFGRTSVGDGVLPCAAPEAVRAGPADEDIITRAAPEYVVAGITCEVIVVAGTDQVLNVGQPVAWASPRSPAPVRRFTVTPAREPNKTPCRCRPRRPRDLRRRGPTARCCGHCR